MRNLPFHNRIVGILLAQQEAAREEGETYHPLPPDPIEAPRPLDPNAEQVSLAEAFRIGLIGLVQLLPGLLIVVASFLAFIWILTKIWGVG